MLMLKRFHKKKKNNNKGDTVKHATRSIKMIYLLLCNHHRQDRLGKRQEWRPSPGGAWSGGDGSSRCLRESPLNTP